MFAMILIGCVTLMPLLLMVFAYLFHRRRRGSDRPGYTALLRFFGGIADWYTDVFWAYSLYMEAHHLWIPAFVFVFGSHFVSIMIGVYWITKWRQNSHQIHIAEYANRYDKIVIFLSVVSGFYGATALITSHLLHLRVLSLYLDDRERSQLSTIKILNESLLENIPVLVIQIVYLNGTHSPNTDFITLFAMFFTIISIVVMLFTIVERFINHMMGRTSNSGDGLSAITLEFILQSEETRTIKQYHIHTHFLMTEAIRTALEMERSQVKIRRIQKVRHGIKIYAELVMLHDEVTHRILDELQDNNDLNMNPLYCALLNECMDRLAIHVGCITLHVVYIGLSRREDSDNERDIDQQRMLGNIEMQQDFTTVNDDIPSD